MSATILLFHSDYPRSKANRALAESAASIDGVEVCEVASRSKPEAIDVDAEVAHLLRVDRLILQFPINWYSTPPLLKVWQDHVLTRMYYIKAQEEGDRLAGLPVMIAATAGNVPEAYAPDGVNLFALEELLKPLHSTANRCGWQWADPFIVYRANRLNPEELAIEADRYAARIGEWVASTNPVRAE
ncbi:NAD(P)H-dependent oxidoreductase [Sphingomonas oryzagri]